MWGMWMDVGGHVGYVGYVGGCRWVCGACGWM